MRSSHSVSFFALFRSNCCFSDRLLPSTFPISTYQAPTKISCRQFKAGDLVLVSLSSSRIVEATVKAVMNRHDGLRLQVDLWEGCRQASGLLWRSSRLTRHKFLASRLQFLGHPYDQRTKCADVDTMELPINPDPETVWCAANAVLFSLLLWVAILIPFLS